MLRFVSVFGIIFLTVILLCQPAFAGEDDESDEQSSDWGNFTFSPRLGYALYNNPFGQLTTRHALNLQLNLDFGGAPASGFTFAPYYSYQTTTMPVGFGAFDDADFNVFGIYMGWTRNMHYGNFYPHIGFGTKTGYILSSTGTSGGLETTMRIPFGLTYYILEDLGIDLEMGMGYNFTLLWGDFNWGSGFYMDVMLGIRIP